MRLDWDNDGVMVSKNLDADIKKILLALDITNDVISYAKQNGYNVIVTHHPFLFEPIRSLCPDEYNAKAAMELLESNITVLSYHTRLDAAYEGVSRALCNLFEMEKVEEFGPPSEEYARVGYLKNAVGADKFSAFLKEKLHCEHIRTSFLPEKISKVAVLGGEGKEYIPFAKKTNCDVFVTGNVGYSAMIEAKRAGFSIFEVGHDYSETPVLSILKKNIEKETFGIAADIYPVIGNLLTI